MYLQPCDWIESDVDFKYVVDVYGRTDEGDVARLRLTGFKPYMYLRAGPETDSMVKNALIFEKKLQGLEVIKDFKLDAMQGFSNLQPIAVWKIQCTALWMFKYVSKILKGLKIGTRTVRQEDIYEANLHPLLRLFHERDIQPASALEFEADEMDYEDDNIDVVYQCDYRFVKPFSNINIPLMVCAYDLEVYSESGQFPVSTNPSDQIIQIGVSFRWSDKLLESVARYVFVAGTCAPSADPNVTFVSCKNEKDLLKKFEKCIHDENPDILAGYNTFGFDDGYISDRAEYLNLPLQFGRADYNSWKEGCVRTEKKTFELASGKFAVRYMEVAGRLPIDLYLSMRREQNLDSYKLDSVASTFLRDKVLKIEGKKIYTKSTRGLFVGNLVRLDIITNTINPFRDGHKFQVVNLSDKWFEIDEEVSIEGEVEWSFGKDDISAKEMFASHRGTPEQRAEIAKYCIQDCDLVLTLMAKLDTFVNARGMADVCRVPIQYIFLRGQGIKIFSAVVYNASKRNQIIMAQGGFEGDSSYEGAIVLPPKIGMYLDQPIPVLDFNSLYPSNMIAYNLSPDTLVYVKTFDVNGKKLSQEGKEIEGYKVDEISYDLKDDDGNIKGRQTCGFVQPTEDPQTIGLLPLTLDILLKKRKETRKLIEKTEDDAQKSVLNGLQLAYKVVANSVYGQCGSSTSPIRKIEVAACTTAAGRERLLFAKKIVVTEFGAEVIYGDSVASYTPVLIRKENKIQIINIEELGNDWYSSGDKEYCELQGVESWTENGWTNIDRIIRHKLAPHKKMIRVLTHTGLVDVTDDHSLLLENGEEISPKNLKIGDTLLHHEYPPQEFQNVSDYNRARIAGFFMGDGSCGIYDCPSGEKSSWALNNANPDLLTFYQAICSKVYPEFNWVVNPTLVSSGVFKLVPVGKGIKNFVTSYREMMYVDKRKNIPDWVLNGSREVQQEFWNGLYDADGDKDINGYVRIDQKHQTSAAQIALLANFLGYKISINTRKDKPNVYRITCTTKSQRRNVSAIKKMHEIEYSGFVYDLTTCNHHFQAGIGKMIVHNTDSIFIKFPTKDLRESIEMAKKAAERITSQCRKAHKIEYEKTFYPFVLFCRKRYMGMMYEDDLTKCKRKSMGIAIKRRDNAPIVKDIFGGALDIVMEHRDLKMAQKFVQEMLVKVLKNEMPIEKFIITKQLRDDYKKPGQIVHRILADRMIARDPGNAPQVGDRLAYIYVDGRRDKAKQGDRIEELNYAKEHNLKPDSEFYITNQLQNPLAQLFALGLEDLNGYDGKSDYKYYLSQIIEGGMDEEEATLKVLEMKEKELEKLMFMGAQYLKKHKIGPIDKFFRK